jgi:hypothetical protein
VTVAPINPQSHRFTPMPTKITRNSQPPEHFRPVLPAIEGNVDYLDLRGQLITIYELLRSSGVENEFVARSLKHWIKTLTQSKIEQIELSGLLF